MTNIKKKSKLVKFMDGHIHAVLYVTVEILCSVEQLFFLFEI